MREIKFRIWDSDQGRVLPVITMSYDVDGKQWFGYQLVDAGPEPESMEYCEASADDPTVSVMQFTGLHDKNGLEVYEGDILRKPPESEWNVTNFSAFEVFWHDNDRSPTDVGLCLGRMKNYGSVAGGYCGYKLIPRDVGSMTVIGNIHEHGHLLEGGDA